MTESLVFSTVMSLVTLAIGVVALGAVRKFLGSRAPVLAAGIGILAVAAILTVLPQFGSIARMSVTELLPVAAFFGFLLVQGNPGSRSSVCTGLSLATGAIALAGAFTSELMVAAVAAGVSGYLLNLGAATARQA